MCKMCKWLRPVWIRHSKYQLLFVKEGVVHAASTARLVAVADVLAPDDGLPLRHAGLVCLVAALGSHHHPPGCHGHLPLPDLVWAQLPVLLRYAGQVEVCCCCFRCYGTRSVLFLGHLLLVDVGKECGCWSLSFQVWNFPLFVFVPYLYFCLLI